MKILIILNEGAYSNEKSYNGLRTGIQLLNQFNDAEISYFLFADAVSTVMQNQNPSATKYNAGTLIEELISNGAKIKLCKSCMEARGSITIIEGVEISNMKEYGELIINADKIISF